MSFSAMAGTYRFIEDGAQADIAFTAEADTLPGLLEICGEATFAAMTDTKLVKPADRHTVTVQADALEDLLFDWLSELIFLKDTEEFVASRFRVRCPDKPSFHLQALVEGEPIDRRRHRMNVDVKAVTYHEMDIHQENGRWFAKVVLDV